MIDHKLQNILADIEDYISAKNDNKVFQPGIDTVYYSGDTFDCQEHLAAIETMLKGWLVMGNDCLRFEQIFPRQFNRKYGVLTNSGSSANLLMMKALTSKRGPNLPPGTKVLTPAAGFPSTLNPIIQSGFMPIFCDIELDTLNLDINSAREALKKNPDIKVITFAHVLGNPPNMDEVMDLVREYNLILLEDCCDALGSTYDGQPLGSFGLMASCSFYPAHHMTMGEGGFVVTENERLKEIITSFREWGRGCYCVGQAANKLKNGTCKKRFNNWLPAFPDEIFDHKYVYDEIGYNLKPIEIQGTWGLQQIQKLPEIHRRRRENYNLLYNIYSKYEDFFIIPKAMENSDPSWFAFPLTIKENSPFKRSDLVSFLEDMKIQTRPYFAGNILLQPAYSDLYDQNEIKKLYPNATYTSLHTFFHGTSPVITREQMDYIGECVDEFMGKYI